MPHFKASLSLVIATLFLHSGEAADCNLDQPRSSSDPSGAAIAADLRGQENGILQNVCNGEFPPGSDTISTWNTGSQIYNLTRSDPNQPLQYCMDALDNIITQCIENDNYWGGDWKLGGEIYAIYDNEWPAHILQAELNSPSSNAVQESTSSSVTEESTSSAVEENTAVPAGATIVTTTIDGSPITQTFVPTTIPNASPTTSSTTIDGVVVPLIIGLGGVAWIPFVPVGGIPPAQITPPANLPDGSEGDGDNNDNQSSSPDQSSSSSSSSSSSKSLRAPDDILPADPGTATFDAAAAAQIVFFGAAAATPSVTSTATSSDTAPPTETADPFAEAKKLCHDKCSGRPSATTPDGQWCIANCGCFSGAAGC